MIRSFGKVAEQQTILIGEPDRPFQPGEPFAERHERRIRQHIGSKAGVQDFESVHYLKRQGLRVGGICSWTVINTAEASPIVPERWPLRPFVSVQA